MSWFDSISDAEIWERLEASPNDPVMSRVCQAYGGSAQRWVGVVHDLEAMPREQVDLRCRGSWGGRFVYWDSDTGRFAYVAATD